MVTPQGSDWEPPLRRRMPWLTVQVGPAGRFLHLVVVKAGRQPQIEFFDHTGDTVHASGRLPMADPAQGESLLAFIEHLLSMLGAQTDYARDRRDYSAGLTRIPLYRSTRSAHAQLEERHAGPDGGDRAGGGADLAGGAAAGQGGADDPAPAPGVLRPDRLVRSGLAAIPAADAAGNTDHGRADRDAQQPDGQPDAAGAGLDSGRIARDSDLPAPYAAVERDGLRVEYWADEKGFVVRRSTRPGGRRMLSRWLSGTPARARSEIDVIVGTRLVSGWKQII